MDFKKRKSVVEKIDDEKNTKLFQQIHKNQKVCTNLRINGIVELCLTATIKPLDV